VTDLPLKGKVAIVTGAGRGIGRAIAISFAAAGCDVVLTARSRDQLESVSREVTERGGRALVHPADVSVEEHVTSLFAATQAWADRLDLLVNNAGDNRRSNVEAARLEDWQHIWHANATSSFLCSRAAIAPMRAVGGGRIINITSMAAKRGSATRGAYSAAKFAVHGLMEALATELQADGILITNICPGPVATALRARSVPEEDPSTILQPDEIAEAVFFVATRSLRVILPEICLTPVPN
jgi:3-oxoacyl-[acyl-carrier protein] reductase